MAEVLSRLHRLAEDDDFFDNFVNSNPHLSDEPPTSTVASVAPYNGNGTLPPSFGAPGPYDSPVASSGFPRPSSTGRVRSASEIDARSSVPSFLEGGASDIRRERERVAAMRSAAAIGLSPGVAALDGEELQRAIAETEAKLEEQQRSGVLAATVLQRVTQHLEEKNANVKRIKDEFRPALQAAQGLMNVVVASRKNAGLHAGVSEDALEALPRGPQSHAHSEVFSQSLPAVASLCDDLTWLEWVIDSVVPALLTEESKLRAAAYLKYEDQHALLRQQLEEQAAVLREAQGALEGMAAEVERLRLQRDELKVTLARVEQDIATLEADTSGNTEMELVKAVDAAQRTLEESRRKADALALQRSEAERDKHDAVLVLQTEQELLQAAEASLKATTEQISKTKAERARGRQDLDSFERQVALHDRDITKARQATAASEEELSRLQTKATDLKGQRDRVLAEIKFATRGLDSLRTEVNEKVARRQQVEAEIARILAETQTLRARKSELLQKQIDAEEEITTLRQQTAASDERAAYLVALLPVHHPLRRSPSDGAAPSSA